MTHRSYRFEHSDVAVDNQRMEFLGDAVLGFVVAAYLYERYEDQAEGELTSFRSQVTSGKALAKLAATIDLGSFIMMGKGELASGGSTRASNLTDALEAVIGAAYLDGGLKAAQKIVKKLFVSQMEDMPTDVWSVNPKGRLQEYCQRKWKCGPQYRVMSKEGPPHAAVFTVEVVLDDKVHGVSRGHTKQDAEAGAASDALTRLGLV